MQHLRVWAAILLAGTASCVLAQDYPARPVRMIVPLSPGGSADALARLVSQGLTERLGKSFVVENRAGGGGNIGAEFVAKAPADGYTLLTAGSPQAIGMSLYQKLPYDMARDLAPITQGATLPSVIAVHPSLPVKTMKELIALAKARPGQLAYGANTGSPNHLGMEMLGVKFTFVPYKGAGQVVGDLIAGHVQLASLGLPSAIGMVQAGRLRALAVTGLNRSAQLPDVPTVNEAAIPGYNVSLWFGFFAPANTPRELITRLNTEITAVLKSPEVNTKLVALGAEAAPSSPEAFGKFVRDEIATWAKVVKATGARAE